MKRWLRWLHIALPLLLAGGSVAHAQTYTLTLELHQAPLPASTVDITRPDQLPHSMLSRGKGPIDSAWLAGPTRRYAHGVLGDRVEASRLVVRLRQGGERVLELPAHRVFEDLSVRLADLDEDGIEEMMVVESDDRRGASLAIYALAEDRIVLRARSPFIGLPHRWLNPLGSGDFDGDGHLDLALVRTPHIGGVLEVYRFTEPELTLMVTRSGLSTHAIGSTELGLGTVVSGRRRDLMLLPEQDHAHLVLAGIRDGALRELARASLPGRIETSLRPAGPRAFAFTLDDGRTYRVQVRLSE